MKRIMNWVLAIVFLIPSEFQFAIATKPTGSWGDIFTGSFKNQVTPPAGSDYAQLGRCNRASSSCASCCNMCRDSSMVSSSRRANN